MKKEKFNIQGMTCSSCSQHVEKAVKKLDGIQNVNVNLISNNMIVEYDEEKLSNEDIIQSVIDAGYGASLNKDKDNVTVKEINNDDNIKSMKKRLTISIIFLIPLMYIAMNNMFKEINNSLVFAFTQLLLLIPIIYVNRNYFIVGIKRLLKRSPNMDSLIAIGSGAAIIYGIVAIYMIGYRIRK